MKDERGKEPHLHLLLEDYDKRSQQRPGSAVTRRSESQADPLPIRLLIEDYPGRTRDWLAHATPRIPHWDEPKTRQDAGQQTLHLLLDDYRPGADWPAGSAPKATIATNGAASRSAAAHANGTARPVVSSAPQGDATGPDLETHWEGRSGALRRRKALAASLGVHGVWIVLLLLQPRVLPLPAELVDPSEVSQVTILAPPDSFLRELTQTEANKGPVTNRFQGAEETPVPVLPRKEALQPPPDIRPAVPPPPAVEKPEGPPSLEPKTVPQIATEKPEEAPAAKSPTPGELSQGTELARARRPNELPAPRRPATSPEKPKLELETPPATSPGRQGPLEFGSLTLNPRPGQMVENAIQELSRNGSTGRQAVGDDFGTGGIAGQLPPSPGNTGSNIELLSDPQGVDFRPYLMQVLAAVRRNWYAVIPESARLGFVKGRTLIQFAIVQDGRVSKLVIATSSGSQPLDRAAVAGISASHPFPPLPAEYKGADVRLQFSFLYNIKTK